MPVLLDRDGVINEDTPLGITHPSQLILIPGAASAIARLNAAGVKVAVVTNQSVVGKGLITLAQLDAIHDALRAALAQEQARLDAIYVAPDAPDAPSERRKPGAGMLREALADFAADPARTPMVGDALRDVQAAYAAGCPRHLVLTGKGEDTARSPELTSLQPVTQHADLQAFVTYWLPHLHRFQ